MRFWKVPTLKKTYRESITHYDKRVLKKFIQNSTNTTDVLLGLQSKITDDSDDFEETTYVLDINFIECCKCFCSILGKQALYVACNMRYCEECLGGPIQMEFI